MVVAVLLWTDYIAEIKNTNAYFRHQIDSSQIYLRKINKAKPILCVVRGKKKNKILKTICSLI